MRLYGSAASRPATDAKSSSNFSMPPASLVAQDDRPLVLSGPRAAGSGLAVYGLMLPSELGAGPYQLIAGIYDPTQEGAPRLKTTDGVDHVTLREYKLSPHDGHRSSVGRN